ncbi:hypothetical protein [Catenulispora rubra]|uniref:hypothetical protein n=1 Tax=Catenulispora rubra TaxID=280293 RepID=UPI00189211D6|nr:hypothetical protein [Catenulispora rubra]
MSTPGYLFPLGATAAAAGVTYLSCVRPMLRGRGCAAGGPDEAGTSQCSTNSPEDAEEVDAEIRRLAEEVQLLRHELDLRADLDVGNLECR